MALVLRETTGTQLAIVIIVARSLGALRSIVETLVLPRAREDRVIGVGLDVLLQILRALEALATELTLVRLERHMDSDVGCDVVTLDRGCAARIPLAGKTQVVGAFTTNMALTNVLIEILWARKLLVARIPATCQVLLKGAVLRSVGGCARGSRRVGLGVTAVTRRRRSLSRVGDLRCHGGVSRLGMAVGVL